MRNPKEIKEEGKTLLFANYLPFVLVALILAFILVVALRPRYGY